MHDEHKSASYEEICELKKKFLKIVDAELNEKSTKELNTEELGQVVDMIKDLAEAERLVTISLLLKQ